MLPASTEAGLDIIPDLVYNLPMREKRKKHNEKEKEFDPTGSGDIFRDFGFSDQESAALKIKACFFRKLQAALKESACTQTELAIKLRIPQPKVSDIINGKMAGFSVERIVNLLIKLDYVIGLDAKPAAKGARGCVVDLAEERNRSNLIEA
ncbi:MAG: helix-turn-helix domain-containing protein [Candidatus Obscuribacterales bacterium]|nr:helix-turn-helix domain-containing protein [Candidatus Obscuribacterales bacterium]